MNVRGRRPWRCAPSRYIGLHRAQASVRSRFRDLAVASASPAVANGPCQMLLFVVFLP